MFKASYVPLMVTIERLDKGYGYQSDGMPSSLHDVEASKMLRECLFT